MARVIFSAWLAQSLMLCCRGYMLKIPCMPLVRDMAPPVECGQTTPMHYIARPPFNLKIMHPLDLLIIHPHALQVTILTVAQRVTLPAMPQLPALVAAGVCFWLVFPVRQILYRLAVDDALDAETTRSLWWLKHTTTCYLLYTAWNFVYGSLWLVSTYRMLLR